MNLQGFRAGRGQAQVLRDGAIPSGLLKEVSLVLPGFHFNRRKTQFGTLYPDRETATASGAPREPG